MIASSGVELHQRGHGYMGCCPFHDDSTASMSVGAVPDRFKCFGCGAGGDVIEYVSRRYDLSFIDSIQALQNRTIGTGSVAPLPATGNFATREPDLPRISTDRAYEINQRAWEHFATPVAAEFAQSYLSSRRGIDLGALRAFSGGEPVVGYAGTGWTTLVSRLHDQGVSDDELLGTDLAQITRGGRLVDTYRGRIIIPVTNSAGQINGFVGRDVTGDDRAPKYRNPTRTSTFNKSTILYRPTQHALAADATVVIVEGVLDALAIAATAARRGEMDRFAPCTTSGVTASHEQVCRVLALHGRPPVIALDGDRAGVEGTGRWLSGLCLDERAAGPRDHASDRNRPGGMACRAWRLGPDGLRPSRAVEHRRSGRPPVTTGPRTCPSSRRSTRAARGGRPGQPGPARGAAASRTRCPPPSGSRAGDDPARLEPERLLHPRADRGLNTGANGQ